MRYHLDRVQVLPKDERRTHFKFRQVTRPGIEFVYTVIDENYRTPQRWEFLVRVPDASGESVEVRPSLVPNVRAWAGLDRRALMFQRATIGRYRGQAYCKVALADETGERTRIEVKAVERSHLPYWFHALDSRLRRKEVVRRTRGTDADALVAIVAPDDHEMMIRIFLAAKAWVLKEKFRMKSRAA
jgi:hypothetical protein